MIYKWNLNDAMKYYKNDSFCNHYCIDQNWKYGCKNENKCPFGTHTINLQDLIWPDDNKSTDFKTGKLLCLYSMYKQVYNDKNPMLFKCYADVLQYGEEDYIKCEKYYLKALSVDNNIANLHNNYGSLLHKKLQNYDRAEYHYKQALKIDPNHAVGNSNFGSFLMDVQKKYDEALKYCEKACKLSPNNSFSHYWKGKALFYLHGFDESVEETLIALKLNERNHNMWESRVKEAIEQMESGLERYIESRFDKDVFKWLELKSKNSDCENDSKKQESTVHCVSD